MDRPRVDRWQRPGRPRQTGQVWMFGASPNDSSQPQNIFVRVFSWTWIWSPMTGSYSTAADVALMRAAARTSA